MVPCTSAGEMKSVLITKSLCIQVSWEGGATPLTCRWQCPNETFRLKSIYKTFGTMLTVTRLTLVSILTSLPASYAMSVENDVKAGNASTLAASAGGHEVRKMRHIEAELELLRRAVTDSKAGAQCGTQSPHPNVLNEVTQEIQALRSQFHALQLRRELSVLRSDILRVQSEILQEPGSRQTILSDPESKANAASGAVYERWGHHECPNNTEIVYAGIIGGSSHAHTGTAGNALCLPLNPVLETQARDTTVTVIYGSEYEVGPLPQHNLDSQCAVCRTSRASVLILPAVSACHPGWTLEYAGYLMAGHYLHPAATEFICVDTGRHARSGSQKDDNGYLLYLVSASCGSLPCPPYENGKVLPCAVCSK